jgi:Rha family phage regulatory protein
MLKLNQKTISSLEIAEISGKAHNDVLKSIRSMESSWKKVNGGNFSLITYSDERNRQKPMYSLSFEESLYVASKYDDITRAKLVKHWSDSKKGKSSDIDAEIAADRDYIKKLYLELNSLEDANKSNNKRIKEIRAIVKEVSLKDYSTPNLFLQS